MVIVCVISINDHVDIAGIYNLILLLPITWYSESTSVGLCPLSVE